MTGADAALAAALRSELEQFRQFHQILQNEQETLAKGDIDTLVKLAQMKTDKVTLLSQLTGRRLSALKSLSFTPDHSGFTQWIKHCDPDNSKGVARDWEALLELAKSAQHLNEVNGALIKTKLRHNQDALAVLFGATNKVSLYGANGQAYTVNGSRPLGKV
jgi:flagella synthesis protein FlgN